MERQEVLKEIAALSERILRVEQRMGEISEMRHNESAASCEDLNNAVAEMGGE